MASPAVSPSTNTLQKCGEPNFYDQPRAVQIFKFEDWLQTSNKSENPRNDTDSASTDRGSVLSNFRKDVVSLARDIKAEVKGAAEFAIGTFAGSRRRPCFDHEVLQKILCHESVRDVLIVPFCVAGSFRSGKSFLLNFMLRYINALPNVAGEKWETKDATSPLMPDERSILMKEPTKSHTWLGGEAAQANDGFDWQIGDESHTQGIWVWSRAIRVQHSGTVYAVVLLDTQVKLCPYIT